MDASDLVSQLMHTFLAELEGHVRVMNEELLGLERVAAEDERAARIAVLLRALHSLKGAARAVNLGMIETVCHDLEAILIAVRDGTRALDAELIALLFAAADAFEDGGRRLREGRALESSLLAELRTRMEAEPGFHLEAGLARPRRAAVEAAPPSRDAEAAVRLRDTAAVTPGSDRVGEAVVRVTAERLDALVADGGELVIAHHRLQSRRDELVALYELVRRWNTDHRRSATSRASTWERLQRIEKELDRLVTCVTADGHALGSVAVRLGDDVRRTRMVPFAESCAGLFRAARDLAKTTGKDVELVLDGGDIELDRSVVESIKDPLLHLVRNAVDHGIEAPAARRAAWKPVRGRITVAAALRGARVEVVVADDGRGIDVAAVRARAGEQGLGVAESDLEVVGLIFAAGLSTATTVTDVSGRGLGLDVVKNRLEALNGTIDVASQAGRGSRFTLSLPLTLTNLRALLVVAAGQTFAIAGAAISELRRIRTDALPVVQGRPALSIEGRCVPVVTLAHVLGLGAAPLPAGSVPALIVAAGGVRAALVVDELLMEQEIVVKSLGRRLAGLRAVAGGTLLPSGQVALVLNAAYVARRAAAAGARAASAALSVPAAPRRKRVLVVDDSVTTRSLEKSILETAGYHVDVAGDGELGWRMLQERGADVLVTDVEMPRMDGIALTETVRGSPRFRDLPVVLVTSHESDADKARGLRAGADAYLVKSAFDQRTLLETIAQLL